MLAIALLGLTASGRQGRRLQHECGAGRELCAPDFRKSYTKHGTALREHLLSGYDKVMPPTSTRTGAQNYSQAGTVVQVQTRFFKVREVSASSGHMKLKVWFRTKWVDERLSWDPAEFGNITTLPFLGEAVTDPETNEIWLPDLQPYNAIEGTVSTLEPAIASVSSDGSVFWSRPGMFDIMCKFSGLVAFPFDQLKCDIEIGGWTLSGAYQGVQLYGETPGYELKAQETSSGSSYQEYTIRDVSCVLRLYSYPDYPSESWPIIYYRISLYRHDYFYRNFILVPCVVLACVSFLPFWMNWEVGERLSFGITLVLTMTTYQAIANALLPICGELLWIEVFSQYHFFATIIALMETCVVLAFAYTTTENFLPDWVIEVQGKAAELWHQMLLLLTVRGGAERREERRQAAREQRKSTMHVPSNSMVRRWDTGLVLNITRSQARARRPRRLCLLLAAGPRHSSSTAAALGPCPLAAPSASITARKWRRRP